MLRTSCCFIPILWQVSNEIAIVGRLCFGTNRVHQLLYVDCITSVLIRTWRRVTRIIPNNRVEGLTVGHDNLLKRICDQLHFKQSWVTDMGQNDAATNP
jgi:hypothetical protein